MVRIDHFVLGDVALKEDDRQKVCIINIRELDELKLSAAVLRCRDHGSVVRVHREKLRNLLKKILDPVGFLVEDFFHVVDFLNLLFHHLVDIKSVALVGRDTPCRSMGLNKVPELFEVGHLVTYGGGA